MERIISIILICIPFMITVAISIYQFYFLWSNRISKEKFFRDRMILGIIRGIANIIAIAVNLSFGFKEISIILAIITLNLIVMDVIIFIFGKFIK